MEMRTGNLWKKIMIYSLPLMVTNLLQLLFNIADVAIVGKFAGSLSLGAVGSTTLLVSLTTGWFIGISNGVNAMVAYYIGSDDEKNKARAVNIGFALSMIIGVVVAIVGFHYARMALTVLGTKDELIEEAILYFRIYMLGSPALAVFNYGNAVLSAEGNTREPLKYLMISGVINVILNLIFVINLHMTADGVALASIISQYISAILILSLLIRNKEQYQFDVRQITFDASMTGKILKIGVPAAIQYSLFAVANLFVQSAINSFDHVVVEGNSAAMNFDAIVYDMMAAFYVASTSFIAQNYGAQKKDRVMKTYFITTAYSFGLAFVLGAILHVSRFQVLYIFTNDADVVAAGAIRLGTLSICYCLSAFMDNATAACRGLGKTIIPTIIVMCGSIVFRIVWIYTVFAHFHILNLLYIMYGCSFVLTAILGNIYFFALYKKTFQENN